MDSNPTSNITCRNSHARELSPYLPGDGGDKADFFLRRNNSILSMFCLVCDDFLVRNPQKKHGNENTTILPGKITSHEKRYLGGECLVLRGTPFQSEMG